MNVDGKIIIVTGAGSGIGRALVEKFVAEGARQVVAAGLLNQVGGAASGDGMMESEQLADIVIEGLEKESFLILPHPEVETYMQRKTGDYDRWIKGMNRLHLAMSGEQDGGAE